MELGRLISEELKSDAETEKLKLDYLAGKIAEIIGAGLGG